MGEEWDESSPGFFDRRCKSNIETMGVAEDHPDAANPTLLPAHISELLQALALIDIEDERAVDICKDSFRRWVKPEMNMKARRPVSSETVRQFRNVGPYKEEGPLLGQF